LFHESTTIPQAEYIMEKDVYNGSLLQEFGLFLSLHSEDLRRWGRAVKQDWEIRNCLTPSDPVAEVMQTLQRETIALRGEIQSLNNDLQDLKKSASQILSLLQVAQNTDEPKLRSPGSSSMKRPRAYDRIHEEPLKRLALEETATSLVVVENQQANESSSVFINDFFSESNICTLPTTSAKALSLSVLFVREVHGENGHLLGDARNRAKVCLEFLTTLYTPENADYLSISKPSRDSGDYTIWIKTIKEMALTLETKAMEFLLFFEGKDPEKKYKALPTVEAVARRLSAIGRHIWKR
jgi:hypothetical protein